MLFCTSLAYLYNRGSGLDVVGSLRSYLNFIIHQNFVIIIGFSINLWPYKLIISTCGGVSVVCKLWRYSSHTTIYHEVTSFNFNLLIMKVMLIY